MSVYNIPSCVNWTTNQSEQNAITIHSRLIRSVMVLHMYRVAFSKYQSIKSVLLKYDAEMKPSMYTSEIIDLCFFF